MADRQLLNELSDNGIVGGNRISRKDLARCQGSWSDDFSW